MTMSAFLLGALSLGALASAAGIPRHGQRRGDYEAPGILH